MNDYYPGSKQRPGKQSARDEVSPLAYLTPREYLVDGGLVQFYTIGQLGQVLGRKAVTMRTWERTRVLPKATFQAPNPSGDLRGRRRLYSRAQVEGLLRIAVEEGILGEEGKPVGSTRFTERAFKFFKEGS